MDYLEHLFGKAFYNYRGRDAGLFTKQPQFEGIAANIDVTSTVPEVLPADYYGPKPPRLFPPISWTNPEGTQEVIVVIQDVDAPMSQPAVHAIFYNISPEITTLPSEFFSGAKPTYADHGIRVGKNVMWGPYEPPRPLLGHGTHRYFFQVIALNRKLDGVLPEKKASYAQVLKTVRKEDILGWGQWVAKVERKMAGK